MKQNIQNKITNEYIKFSGSWSADLGPLQIRRAGGANTKVLSAREQAGCKTHGAGPVVHQNLMPQTSLK